MTDPSRPLPGRRARLRAALRTVGSAALLLAVYLSRSADRPTALTLALLSAGLVLLVLLLGWQVRSVVRSPYPVLRAIEAFVTATVLFVVLFATVYSALSGADPGAFTQDLSQVDALYFTVTVLATVGFGDIAPVSTVARLVVTLQMVCGFAFAALVGREFLAAIRRAQDGGAQDGGAQEQGGDPPDAAPPVSRP
ncbi:potassium channel family protein [Cellulomonas sp. Marseille-Q8402]